MIIALIIWVIAYAVCLCFNDARKLICGIFNDAIRNIKELWSKKLRIVEVGLLLPLTVIYVVIMFLLFCLLPLLFLIGYVVRTFITPYVERKTEKQPTKSRKQVAIDEIKEWGYTRIKSFYYEGKVPFNIDDNTYLYLENQYNLKLNQYIKNHLGIIYKIFEEYGFRFIYFPFWQPSMEYLSRANLPAEGEKRVKDFLSEKTCADFTELICNAFQIDVAKITGGIFHFVGYRYGYNSSKRRSEILQSKFTYFPLQEVTGENIEDFCRKYCELIKVSRKHKEGACCCIANTQRLKSWELSEKEGCYYADYADYTFPEKMQEIADNIKKEIEQLREGGYYELLLHTLGRDIVDDFRNVKLVPTLSRLVITDDYKIKLADFGKEIKLTPLQKTLYIFYLRHPEGVEFKMLSAYYDELLAIYKVLSNREDLQKQEESIRRLVDVTDNAINEKCSRIKEAILKVADDMIARNYYIVQKENICIGQRLKIITLSRDLVDYPTEISRIKILNPVERMNVLKNKEKEISEQYSLLRKRFSDKKYPKGQLIEEYTTFLNECPKFYRAYFDRAILYIHVGRYREAIADNDILIKHNDNTWLDAYINKAEALYFMKEYDLALEAANRYFEVAKQPEAEGYRIRSCIYKKLKMKEEYKADIKMKKELEDKKKLPF